MSGGSWDYLCYKIADAANQLCADKNPHRKAFGEHMSLIAEAMHDIEWVDSCDKSPGDEIPAIMKCIESSDVMKAIIEDAKSIRDEINKLIEEYENGFVK